MKSKYSSDNEENEGEDQLNLSIDSLGSKRGRPLIQD